MARGRRITVEVPADLLGKAQRSTGQGITATIRKGLELVAAHQTYQELLRLKGKVKLSCDFEKLRRDRWSRSIQLFERTPVG